MDKFKAYQQQMEKALRAFEYTTEWADLVNALGKVNKVLMNYQQFSKIPCDAILGRRLAQCLHPNLPNGVQLKALETYDLLFKAIGSDNLMQELSKFSNGLFPLLSHADLNVKPALLGLYELHFLPLNERLRPALDGFLIATLHGLEENTDFYQRTDDLLAKVCAGVGPEHFYGSLWRCILIDPSVRLHGMTFLTNHFNKKKPLEHQLHILGNSRDALTEAMCVSLLDGNVLVQRAALDLLLCCLPLHNQHIVKNDMIKLATGAVTVLPKRDSTLTNRFRRWVFNLDSKDTSQTGNPSKTTEPRKPREQREKERKVTYFNTYAKPLLLEAFKNCLSDPSKVIDIPNCWAALGECWCYKLLGSVIDVTPELCELIIDDLCIDILRVSCMDFPRENHQSKLANSIKALLTEMDISYLWDRVYLLLLEVCQQRQDALLSDSPERSDLDAECVQPIDQVDKLLVKRVGSGQTDVIELCTIFNFMVECFPIDDYIEFNPGEKAAAKGFLPKVLLNLLDLIINDCDVLKVNEYFALTRVVANMFAVVNTLHKGKLPNKKSLATQVPPPTESNQIPMLAEDDEGVEEASEPHNDSSNNINDDTPDRSHAETLQSSPQSLHPDLSAKRRLITVDLLIAKYQDLFHSFVTKRLLRNYDASELYQRAARSLEQIHLGRENGYRSDAKVLIDANLIEVYETICSILSLIASIPVKEDVFDVTRTSIFESLRASSQHSTTRDGAASLSSCLQANEMRSQTGSPSNHMDLREINSELVDHIATNEASVLKQTGTEKMSFSCCRPYIQDLLLLSYMVDDIKINYASTNLLLSMLSSSKQVLDLDFARANQKINLVAPSFSEELNASVAIDATLTFEDAPNESEDHDELRRLLLTNEEFYFISDQTCWYPLAMEVLWDYLSTEPMMRLETVEIMQTMHNLTYQTLVCEDIICASLNSDNEKVAYEARRKFILLFFLMKSERSSLDLKQKEFERPLFFMLDSLANEMDPFNCIARDWLTQVYKFRNTSRVLEPILRILLHPDTVRTPINPRKINISSKHHERMHLYSQIYDSQRILYALNTLWNILTTDPHQGLIRMANSSIKGCHELQLLYARHANALVGSSSHDDITVDSRATQVPSFLELTIATCLDFLSSQYMMLPSMKLSDADIHGNHKVRMLACEILRTIFGNLFDAIKGCPTQPIHDMLNRCKVQETILLHIAISVQCAQHAEGTNHQPSSSEELIHFNKTIHDNPDDFQRTLLRCLEELMILEYRVAPPNVISQKEDSRMARTRDIPDISSNSLEYYYNIPISSQRLFLAAVKTALQNAQRSDLHVNWLSMIETTLPISGRSLTRWIGCVISRLCDNLELISNCILDRCEPKSINLTMTPKYLLILMNSLSHLTHYCLLDNGHLTVCQSSGLTQRSESLSTLLPSSINTLSSSSGVNSGSTTTLTSAGTSGPSSLGPVSHVMSNIFHVFSNDQNCEMAGSNSGSGLGQSDPIMVARKEVLNKLSQIIFALIQVWKATGKGQNSWTILGAPADVRKQILALLSPISLRYGVQFMNAIAFVWHELRCKTINRKDVIPACSPDQSLLVEIIASISELPMELVLQTTRQVISKTQVSRNPRCAPLEVSLLQFFLAYIRLFPGSQLIECWKPLLHLLRDGLQLGRPAMPQAQFTLLALLHEFVQTAPLIEERKDQKELQDVAQKLIDLLTTVVGVRLAQTRWLRRGLEVEPGPQHEMSEDDEVSDAACSRSLQPDTSSIFSGESRSSEHFTDADSAITTTGASLAAASATGAPVSAMMAAGVNNGGSLGATPAQTPSMSSSSTTTLDNSYLARYSVQALNAMAEYVAPVLDVVYASDEKEKVVSLISGVMYYVNPYLKNHHAHNSPSFLACSHLLSSISGYQYTRKAWRKDALELLLDPQFFQMDQQSMEHWRVIVDHLMTHDRTTFRDFLSRLSLNQSGGALKIFASRDQENEQRAQLIKRMAFILFCSERGQYHKYMAEIQEKLIEWSRDNPSDLVQSQIMFCFRVLIIRSSPHQLTSLWPYIYTEMVQGLLDIESHLEQCVAMAEAAAANSNPSATAPNSSSHQQDRQAPQQQQQQQQQQQAPLNPSHACSGFQVTPATAARFQLFLYTCKLVDMVLALPADSLPQFQMYRWSFIGAGDDFEPHLVRIERRLTELSQCPHLLPYRNHYPILTLSKIGNLLDLHPFFKTLVKVNRNEYEASELAAAGGQVSSQADGQAAGVAVAANYDDPIKFIDAILESDFLTQ